MKTFWSYLAKILLVVVVVESWFLYDFFHKNEQLLAENTQLEKELFESKEALLASENKMAELEKKSLEGMLKQTNKAVVSGWEKLLNTVEAELNKARESIHELSKPPMPDNSPEAAPSEEQSNSEEAQKNNEPPAPSPEVIKGERT